jgi:hypothetical protein
MEKRSPDLCLLMPRVRELLVMLVLGDSEEASLILYPRPVGWIDSVVLSVQGCKSCNRDKRNKKPSNLTQEGKKNKR